jgi:D-alanyl-D-alanine dipeptidase
MVNYTIDQLCRERGVDREDPRQEADLQTVESEVGRFWAPPSRNPQTPPPHSTGAAVDLTLATDAGELLAMGSPIDAIGVVSEPDYFANTSDPAEQLFHQRRELLRTVMASAGFAQHPNEWWHYSYGDQLWAWRSGAEAAIYAEAGSNSATP